MTRLYIAKTIKLCIVKSFCQGVRRSRSMRGAVKRSRESFTTPVIGRVSPANVIAPRFSVRSRRWIAQQPPSPLPLWPPSTLTNRSPSRSTSVKTCWRFPSLMKMASPCCGLARSRSAPRADVLQRPRELGVAAERRHDRSGAVGRIEERDRAPGRVGEDVSRAQQPPERSHHQAAGREHALASHRGACAQAEPPLVGLVRQATASMYASRRPRGSSRIPRSASFRNISAALSASDVRNASGSLGHDRGGAEVEDVRRDGARDGRRGLIFAERDLARAGARPADGRRGPRARRARRSPGSAGARPGPGRETSSVASASPMCASLSEHRAPPAQRPSTTAAGSPRTARNADNSTAGEHEGVAIRVLPVQRRDAGRADLRQPGLRATRDETSRIDLLHVRPDERGAEARRQIAPEARARSRSGPGRLSGSTDSCGPCRPRRLRQRRPRRACPR